MLYTAHKVLHTYVVILLPSSNDAYGPSPAAIIYPGQLSNESPYPKRVQRSKEGPNSGPSYHRYSWTDRVEQPNPYSVRFSVVYRKVPKRA